MKRLLIGADLVPTATNTELFRDGDVMSLLGDALCELWLSADARIFNLEAPLYDGYSPIPKCGPNLAAPESSVAGLAALRPSVIALANNHIMDHGVAGLESTLRLLRMQGLESTGVGRDLVSAGTVKVLELGEQRIAFVACCEHEFSCATESAAGASPYDPLKIAERIRATKSSGCTHIVVLYHGGREHYRYPSPALRERCRSLIECGVDVVICQHSHCVGCEESYLAGRIIYGQGNFIFDYHDAEEWQTGLLVELQFGDDRALSVCYHPLAKRGNCVRLAEGAEADGILGAFDARSRQICEDGFVERNFTQVALLALPGYVASFRPEESQRMQMMNYLDCEAHRECFLQGLRANGSLVCPVDDTPRTVLMRVREKIRRCLRRIA